MFINVCAYSSHIPVSSADCTNTYLSTCTVYPYFIREMQFFECIRLTVHFIREIIKSAIGFVINEIQKKYLWKLERCI